MEQTNNKLTHAYQLLMRKEGVNVSDLDVETQGFIKDLNQTTQVLVNKSKGGEIKLTPQTQRKIKNYDRAICEGIYDYLELEDESPSQPTTSEKEEEQLKAIHDKKQAEEGGQVQGNSNANSLQDIDLEPTPVQNYADGEEELSEEKVKNVQIGFWDWE